MEKTTRTLKHELVQFGQRQRTGTYRFLKEFNENDNTVVMPQPPSSADMAPCDFILFLKFKMIFKIQRISTKDSRRHFPLVFFKLTTALAYMYYMNGKLL